jgi:hypothetical protein
VLPTVSSDAASPTTTTTQAVLAAPLAKLTRLLKAVVVHLFGLTG